MSLLRSDLALYLLPLPALVLTGIITIRGPLRVIRVGLTGSRRLPVYPGERTFSGMSQRCQQATSHSRFARRPYSSSLGLGSDCFGGIWSQESASLNQASLSRGFLAFSAMRRHSAACSRYLEHGRMPISARLFSGFSWIDDIMLPLYWAGALPISLSPITAAYSDGIRQCGAGQYCSHRTKARNHSNPHMKIYPLSPEPLIG
jgi:hypothetical protein